MRPLGFPVTATGPERDAATWAAHQLREQMCVVWTPGVVTHSTINTEKPKVNSASRGTELQTRGALGIHSGQLHFLQDELIYSLCGFFRGRVAVNVI